MTSRDRIATVLRVRRIQELQAAGELAHAARATRDAESALDGAREHYDEHRHLDLTDAAVAGAGRGELVPARLHDREIRILHATAIQRGRERVRAAVAEADERRMDLQVRSQAVRAMERLDERLAEADEAERLRAEVREVDDRTTALAGRKLR